MLRLTLMTLLSGLLIVGCNQQQANELQQQTSNKALDYTPQLNDPSTDIDSAPNAEAEASEVEAVEDQQQVRMATVDLVPIGDSKVEGSVRFVQEGDKVKIAGTVTGLSPGRHGFHVHEHGDLSDKKEGKSAGGHYNPTNKPHGRPSEEERHVGDLGNIEANDKGVAKIDMQDSVISLSGPHSIVDRSLMIHEGEDKFTQPTGDAGGRVAFGLIKAEQNATNP